MNLINLIKNEGDVISNCRDFHTKLQHGTPRGNEEYARLFETERDLLDGTDYDYRLTTG